ncbi:triosephosphate isomerase [Fervidobacterium changbaicum]|uniref:Triosephosphate isomerase n=3 Tax=Fervidobacteriaceae TaxID=1643950 RepID=A0AAI8CII6_FERIS|nr:triose-phosphate isomerase [Fervidobacterium islandicum]QAV33914.1 triose-phosphate isomerase [Fervidobacterium changbaicum]SDH55688.1 triosephosphate isomerase [Fervidobacterium changbaicum]
MNKTPSEAQLFANTLTNAFAGFNSFDIYIAPVFVALDRVREVVASSNIKLAAQNMYFEDSGAFTGEVSPKMLKEIGVQAVIIGHSERRRIFGETDELINKKVKKALAEGLTPIFCIGETLEERQKGLTFCVLEKQVREGLYGISAEDVKKVVIAYEPVWAIGTGVVATPEQAQEAHEFVRALLEKMYGGEVAQSVTILYGGSVTPENFFGLFVKPDIDGALVGGASLKESFVELAKIMASVLG